VVILAKNYHSHTPSRFRRGLLDSMNSVTRNARCTKIVNERNAISRIQSHDDFADALPLSCAAIDVQYLCFAGVRSRPLPAPSSCNHHSDDNFRDHRRPFHWKALPCQRPMQPHRARTLDDRLLCHRPADIVSLLSAAIDSVPEPHRLTCGLESPCSGWKA